MRDKQEDLADEKSEEVLREMEKALNDGVLAEPVEELETESELKPELSTSKSTTEKEEDLKPKLDGESSMPPPPTFKRGVKRKKDLGAALGIKKKVALV